jgi:enoyl-CoA hydratase/carnithine racemase
VDVGLPAVFGGYLVNLHLRRSRTTETVLTGKTTPAEEAARLGLVREIVPADQLAERARAVAGELAGKPPVAMGLNVKMFRGWVRGEMEDVRSAAVKLQSEAVASGQPQEAMRRFFDRRQKAG